jgi:hypothetical protein
MAIHIAASHYRLDKSTAPHYNARLFGKFEEDLLECFTSLVVADDNKDVLLTWYVEDTFDRNAHNVVSRLLKSRKIL